MSLSIELKVNKKNRIFKWDIKNPFEMSTLRILNGFVLQDWNGAENYLLLAILEIFMTIKKQVEHWTGYLRWP